MLAVSDSPLYAQLISMFPITYLCRISFVLADFNNKVRRCVHRIHRKHCEGVSSRQHSGESIALVSSETEWVPAWLQSGHVH